MQKVMFTRTVKVAQGDGKGPVFESGKAYWMREDSAAYWRSEDAVTDAPDDMPAENEPVPEALRAADVRIQHRGRGRYDVLGPNGQKFNDGLLDAAGAERMRADVLAGKVKVQAPMVAPPEPLADLRTLANLVDIRADVVVLDKSSDALHGGDDDEDAAATGSDEPENEDHSF